LVVSLVINVVVIGLTLYVSGKKCMKRRFRLVLPSEEAVTKGAKYKKKKNGEQREEQRVDAEEEREEEEGEVAFFCKYFFL